MRNAQEHEQLLGQYCTKAFFLTMIVELSDFGPRIQDVMVFIAQDLETLPDIIGYGVLYEHQVDP